MALALGIQPGSLYYHIESKQSLLYDIIEEYEHALLALFIGSARHSPPPARQLHALIENTLQFMRHNRDAALVARRELRHLNPAQHTQVQALRERRRWHLQHLIGTCTEHSRPRSIQFMAMLDHGLEACLAENEALAELIKAQLKMIAFNTQVPGSTLLGRHHNAEFRSSIAGGST